tara:strand:+ start:133 stop:306 length:174 start_codon:yes stop_codon:yes gene_type:complete
MDESRGVCIGCLRTQDEIGGWITFSDHVKKKVLLKATKRKKRKQRYLQKNINNISRI